MSRPGAGAELAAWQRRYNERLWCEVCSMLRAVVLCCSIFESALGTCV